MGTYTNAAGFARASMTRLQHPHSRDIRAARPATGISKCKDGFLKVLLAGKSTGIARIKFT